MDLSSERFTRRSSVFTSRGMPRQALTGGHPALIPPAGGDLSSALAGRRPAHHLISDTGLQPMTSSNSTVLPPTTTVQPAVQLVGPPVGFLSGNGGLPTGSSGFGSYTHPAPAIGNNQVRQARVRWWDSPSTFVEPSPLAPDHHPRSSTFVEPSSIAPDHQPRSHAGRPPRTPVHTIGTTTESATLHSAASQPAVSVPIQCPPLVPQQKAEPRPNADQEDGPFADSAYTPPFENYEYSVQTGVTLGPTHSSLTADELSARAEIKSHPLYPDLVAAHVDLCKIGADDDDRLAIEEAYHAFQQSLHDSYRSSYPGAIIPELDLTLSWYLERLEEMKQRVEVPYREEMDWCAKTLENVTALGAEIIAPAAGTVTGGSPEKAGQTASKDKGKLKERTETLESKKEKDLALRLAEEKALKEWLKTQHDKSAIIDLREQCKKKRKQGKHSDEALDGLMRWFESHSDWPYPTEEEKVKLQSKTKLTAAQVNNWFINYRKRHWAAAHKAAALKLIDDQVAAAPDSFWDTDFAYVPPLSPSAGEGSSSSNAQA